MFRKDNADRGHEFCIKLIGGITSVLSDMAPSLPLPAGRVDEFLLASGLGDVNSFLMSVQR